jgi:hypothetical protein
MGMLHKMEPMVQAKSGPIRMTSSAHTRLASIADSGKPSAFLGLGLMVVS